MPGWFGRFVSGAAGGLAGGVVFGILMQLTGTIPVVASLVDQESVVVGWAVHMSIAVFVGLTYTLIFGLFSEGLPISTVLAGFYGIIWWVLGGLTLMPLRLGMGLFVFDTAAWQSLAGHIAYGLVLGMVYAVVAHRLARRRERGRARSLGDPPPVVSRAAIPPPVISPAALPPPLPPPVSRPSPAAYPRSGVTPLSPQARALRQRGQRRS